MNYNEFKSNPELVDKARAALADPLVVELINMVMQGPPCAVYPLPRIGSAESDKAMMLGMDYGFRFFHDRLVGLGVKAAESEELEARYRLDKP